MGNSNDCPIKAAIADLERKQRVIEYVLGGLRSLDTAGVYPSSEPVQLSTPSPASASLNPVKVKRAKASKKKAAAKEQATPAARTSDDRNPPGSLQAAVLSAIKAKPMSSREVFEKLSASGIKTTQDSVYQTCALLKVKGELETRTDPDNTRRYYLIEGAAA